MSPQPTKQQLEQAVRVWDEKVKAKTLECASLQQMLKCAPDFIGKVFNFRDEEKQQPCQDAVHNFLTAKFNQAVIELRELELQLKGIRQQSSGVVGASLIIPGNSTQH